MVIVAAVDGTREQSPVLKHGYELAEAFEEDLVVVTVMSEDEFEDRRESRPAYTLGEAESNVDQTAQRVVNATLGPEANVSIDGCVGEPTNQILARVSEYETHYLVIGARHRSPVGKALLGSITQSILLQADVPVVTVTTEN